MAECKMDEYWIARMRYWPEQKPEVDVVYIYYVWKDGTIDFIPCSVGPEEDPIRSTQCAQFEILEKIDLEKYR
jgi:hypothetical protein